MSQKIEGKSKTEHLNYFEREMEKIFGQNNYATEHLDLFKDNPKQSFLYQSIQKTLKSGRNFAGIALASDGWFQDNPSLFREFVNIPIYTFQPEIDITEPELRITNIIYNKNARKNEIQTIKVNFNTKNITNDIQWTVRHENQRVNSGILNSTAGDTFDFRVNLTKLGLQVFEIELKASDDLTEKGYAAIQVLDHKAKILILTDSFSWDVRLFNRYLNFGDRFDADLIYIENGIYKQKGREVSVKWQDYSGFLVLNHNNFTLRNTDLTGIKNSVMSGAGLVYVGNIHPLFTEILPTRATNIRLISEEQTTLRSEALSYQIFRDMENHWRRLPPVQYYYLSPKEQAVILSEIPVDRSGAGSIPAIILGNFGSGDVLHFAFNGLFRWQLTLDPEVFDRFINGLAQWIYSGKTENFFAYTDKNIYYSGEKITVKLSAFDEKLNPLNTINARLRLFDESGNVVFTDFLVRSNDIFTIDMPVLKAGKYKYHIFDDISMNEAEGEFEVLEQDIQAISKGFNIRLLNDLSMFSGGRLFRGNSDITAEQLGIKRVEAIQKIKYVEIPLFKNWIFIVVIILTFCTELYFRKKWRLL